MLAIHRSNDSEPVPLAHKDIAPVTGMAKYVLSFLDDVSYRLMTSEEDLDQVFRLRHDAYKAAQHIEGTDDGKWTDPSDNCPSASIVGVFVDGELAASVRLHSLKDLHARSSAIQAFPDLLEPRFKAGRSFTDTNRLCCDVKLLNKCKALPLATMRVTGMHGYFFDSDYSLAAVRDQHEAFYKRILGAKRWNEGDGIPFNGTTMTVHLLAASLYDIRIRCYQDRQYFFSTDAERRALFGRENRAENVRPTARQVIEGADSGYWTKTIVPPEIDLITT